MLCQRCAIRTCFEHVFADRRAERSYEAFHPNQRQGQGRVGDLNWPLFEPDGQAEQGGLGTSLSICLCLSLKSSQMGAGDVGGLRPRSCGSLKSPWIAGTASRLWRAAMVPPPIFLYRWRRLILEGGSVAVLTATTGPATRRLARWRTESGSWSASLVKGRSRSIS